MILQLTEIDDCLCSATETIRTAMVRMGESQHIFQIVVDENRQLLGTLTDGDIRRALLQGLTIDSPVTTAMNARPVKGMISRDRDNRQTLASVPGIISFLPIVDDNNILRSVLLRPEHQTMTNAVALVMAGGFGRRLGERTRTTPKPLIEVGGTPVIGHVLEGIERAGFQRIFVATHYLTEQIEAYITERDNISEITTLFEDEPMGTAGALNLVPQLDDINILVMNADVVTRIDLSALISFHEQHDFDATIASAQHETMVPYGVLHCDEHGNLTSIEEKPTIRNFVSAGIYLLSPRITALAPQGRPVDMPEILNAGRAHGLKIGLFPIHEYWRDIGRPNDLETASEDIRRGELS